MRRAALVIVIVLVAAGCGAQTKDTPPREPHLPRALAESLARQADAVASALASNDGCAARTRAATLQQSVIAAVNEHHVPRRFLEPLSSGVNELAGRITCTPPPPPPAPVEKPKHEQKHHEHGKHHGKGHED
jgi:hypothetical protein